MKSIFCFAKYTLSWNEILFPITFCLVDFMIVTFLIWFFENKSIFSFSFCDFIFSNLLIWFYIFLIWFFSFLLSMNYIIFFKRFFVFWISSLDLSYELFSIFHVIFVWSFIIRFSIFSFLNVIFLLIVSRWMWLEHWWKFYSIYYYVIRWQKWHSCTMQFQFSV